MLTACDTLCVRMHYEYVLAVGVLISVNSKHELSQHVGFEGGWDDDVTTFRQNFPHEHGACIDVCGGGDVLLGDDVMHAVLPIQLHLGAV